MQQQPLQMGSREWLLMFILAFIWGGSFIAVEIALEELPSLSIVTFRVGGAALALYIFTKVSKISIVFPEGAQVRTILSGMLLLALFNNALPFTAIVWGQTQIDAGLASILNATMPFFTAFIAHFSVKEERITVTSFLGTVLGFFGVAVIFSGTLGSNGASTGLLGQLSVLAGACSYGIAAVIGRKLVKHGVQPVTMALGQLSMATIILLPVSLVYDEPWVLSFPSVSVWVALVVLAVACSALAYVLYFRLIQAAGATNTSFITLLIPAFAILMGIVMFGETFHSTHGYGLMLIACGMAVMDGRIIKKLQFST